MAKNTGFWAVENIEYISYLMYSKVSEVKRQNQSIKIVRSSVISKIEGIINNISIYIDYIWIFIVSVISL